MPGSRKHTTIDAPRGESITAVAPLSQRPRSHSPGLPRDVTTTRHVIIASFERAFQPPNASALRFSKTCVAVPERPGLPVI